jgi:hypothetical protein
MRGFGGNGVFDLSFAQTGTWAALRPVDPTRVPTKSITIPFWLSLGEISRLQARSFMLGLESDEIAPSADQVWSDAGEDHVGTATQADMMNGFTGGCGAIDYNKPPVHSMSLGCWLPCRIQDSRCWRASMGRLASYSPLESAFELSQLNWFFQIISA